MFHLEISKNRVNLKEREVLVSGASKSHLVQFAFSSDWEGLNRTAVFRAGEVSRSEVLSHTNQCHIPWEVLEMTGRILWAGVEGTDGEGLVLPTVWCALGCISPGAHPGDDEAQPPTPDVYSQLLAVANKAAETAKSVRDDADAGKFDGADGKDGVDGKDGAPGADGADAPQINYAIITDANPWSAKKIVDTLAPEFETSGAVVTCTPVAGYPLHVVSQIMPVQGGEGDPSPDNMRPISGWDSATLTHNDTPITIQLGQTIYGGTLDAVTGEGSEEWKLVEFDGTETWSKYAGATKDGVIVFVIVIPDAALGFQTSICNQFKNLDTAWSRGIPWTYSDYPTLPNKYFCVQTSKFPDVDSWKSYLAAQYAAGTPVQVCYKLDTPQPIQATGGQTIPALSGTNTIYTDTGDTTVSGRADPNTIIQQLAARIAALEGQAINR